MPKCRDIIAYGHKKLILKILASRLRARVAVELNSYIAILILPKHKNHSYSSGAKCIFLTFIATVHSYL